MLQRAVNLFSALYHYAKWRWRFGYFGFRSRLIKPDMITQPKAIHIGDKVYFLTGRLKLLQLEATC